MRYAAVLAAVRTVSPVLVRPANDALWCLRHQTDTEAILAAKEMILDSAVELSGQGWQRAGSDGIGGHAARRDAEDGRGPAEEGERRRTIQRRTEYIRLQHEWTCSY